MLSSAVGTDPEILREIERAVREAGARFALAGQIQVHESTVSLVGNGPTVTVPTGPLAAQWPSLPDDARLRRANELARELSTARRAAVSAGDARRRSSPVGLVAAITLLLLAMLLGGSLLVRHIQEREGSDEPAALRDQQLDAYEVTRRDRARRVCDATRSRVMRGAAVGPADVEGWVTELVLLGVQPQPSRSKTLDGYFAWQQPELREGRARLSWSNAPSVAAAAGPGTVVTFRDASITGAEGAALPGLGATFEGRYVVPYFDPSAHGQYVKLAASIARGTGAQYGALYARCAHRDEPHVGTWFYGPDAGGALTALLFFMGTFGDVPAIRRSALQPGEEKREGPVDRALALRSLRVATEQLERKRVLELLQKQGGMSSGEGPVAITFPLRDANRASRAARDVARALGIGTQR